MEQEGPNFCELQSLHIRTTYLINEPPCYTIFKKDFRPACLTFLLLMNIFFLDVSILELVSS